MTDPYKTLGLGREASAAEIKSAYRKLAKKHHPDLNPGNAERFKNITGAYDILSNPRKRRNLTGATRSCYWRREAGSWFWGQWGGAQKTGKSFSFDEFDGTNNDIFSSFFRNARVIFMGVLKPAVTEKTRRRKITSPKTQITNLLCLLPRPR